MKKEIYVLLVKYSIFYTPIPLKEKLQAYALKLDEDKIDPSEVKAVLDECLKKTNYFPAICEFYKFLEPVVSTDDSANELAGKIISSISAYGPWNIDSVKKEIGELGWSVVNAFGGWPMLCEIKNHEVSSTRAQLRDLSKSFINQKNRGSFKAIASNKKNNLQRLDIFKSLDVS